MVWIAALYQSMGPIGSSFVVLLLLILSWSNRSWQWRDQPTSTGNNDTRVSVPGSFPFSLFVVTIIVLIIVIVQTFTYGRRCLWLLAARIPLIKLSKTLLAFFLNNLIHVFSKKDTSTKYVKILNSHDYLSKQIHKFTIRIIYSPSKHTVVDKKRRQTLLLLLVPSY